MGVLIEMAVRNEKATTAAVEKTKNNAVPTDLSVWEDAPKERTAAYFPTYSAVSKAMQTAMRSWVRESFARTPRY